MLLYIKKNIIVIQEKLSINDNANQIAVHLEPVLEGKILADSYELLIDLIIRILPIRDDFSINGNFILEEVL